MAEAGIEPSVGGILDSYDNALADRRSCRVRHPRMGRLVQSPAPPRAHRRCHESLDNVTRADAYFGRPEAIIKQLESTKRQTIEHRRLKHRKIAAEHQPQDEPDTPLTHGPT